MQLGGGCYYTQDNQSKIKGRDLVEISIQELEKFKPSLYLFDAYCNFVEHNISGEDIRTSRATQIYKCKEMINKAIKIAVNHNNTPLKAYASKLLADILYLEGEKEKACAITKQSADILYKAGFLYQYIEAKRSEAVFYRKDTDDQEGFIAKLLPLAKMAFQEGFYRETYLIYQLLGDAYVAIGDTRNATIYQARSYTLRSYIVNSGRASEMEANEANFEKEKQKILTKQAQENVVKAEREKYIIIVGSTIIGCVLIVLIFAFLKLRKNKRLLEKRNAKIAESEQQKDLLLKEVYHRVKNNMQLVSSLLELQSEFAKDDFAKQVLSEANSRIKALAFAHQKLYLNEDYVNIALADYFNQIIHHLLGQTDCKTTIDIRDDFKVHIEKGQVLGFIINELIVNSLKHAWNNNNKEKHVALTIAINDDNINFVYQDNGVGFPDGFSLDTTKSLGYTLIPSFVNRQLKGVIRHANNNGAEIIITFPL